MVYIAEGFEEQAAKIVREQLRYMINSARNAARVGKSSPSIWSQAAVRRAGVELDGAIDLSCNVLRAMGQDMKPEDLAIAREVARAAINFKYNPRSA